MTYLPRKPYFPESMATKEFALLLASVTMELWDACLVGNPAPSVRRQYEEMKDPKPGDLVLETTTFNRPKWPGAGLGYLLFVCRTKPRTAEEWEEAVEAGYWKMDSSRGHGPYWQIDPIDGSQRTCWSNAQFIKVPRSRETFSGKVVITRENLTAHLSNQGFEIKT